MARTAREVGPKLWFDGEWAHHRPVRSTVGGYAGYSSLDLADAVVAEPALAEPLVQGRHEIMAQVDWAIDRDHHGHGCHDASNPIVLPRPDQGLPPFTQRRANTSDWAGPMTSA